MVNHLGVAERRKVRTGAILRPCAYEPYRPRNNARDHQLVVVHRWPPGLVRVDLHMRNLETGPAVVGTVTEFPVGPDGLSDSPLTFSIPMGTAAFYGFEVGMWVPLDFRLSVHRSCWGVGRGAVPAGESTRHFIPAGNGESMFELFAEASKHI